MSRAYHPPMSEHLSLELAAAHHRDHRPSGLPPVAELYPLVAAYYRAGDPDGARTMLERRSALHSTEPVPGCSCEICTGIPSDHPSRVPAWRRADPGRAARSDDERRERWERRVEAARALGIIEIAARLGCGEPVRLWRKKLAVRCPLHADSDPSCTIDPVAGVWYCWPCGEGGDALDLYMRARRIDFASAVRELAA